MNLNQITVSVVGVERFIAFYEKLGLQLIVKALPHYARFECNKGDSTFSLHKVDEPIATQGTWIYFELDDFDNRVNELIEKGLLFEELPNDKPWLWREARVKDSR